MCDVSIYIDRLAGNSVCCTRCPQKSETAILVTRIFFVNLSLCLFALLLVMVSDYTVLGSIALLLGVTSDVTRYFVDYVRVTSYFLL